MLKRFFYALSFVCCALTPIATSAQCVVEASVVPDEVVCGDAVTLTANGRGQGLQVFDENFNSGTPVGWAFTQQARFDNPCSAGVDSTHLWMGNTSASPRSLETLPYDFTAATSGVTVCFDMLFATQGAGAPCEGPDLPEEGVSLQYSIDGVNWVTIHYFDPNGGNDPLLVNWNNWCFTLPQAALTANTRIRWDQRFDSGPDFDHWGIDNVAIFYNDPTYEIVWQHDGYNYGQGSSGGINPNPARAYQTRGFVVEMSNGVFSCYDTVQVVVTQPALEVNAGPDIRVCDGECATLNATAKVVKSPAKTPTYTNNESVDIVPLSTDTPHLDINITNLNMTSVLPGSITEVCITGLFYFSVLPPSTIGNLDIYLVCPDGTRITLIPSGVTSSPFPASGYANTCFTPVASANLSSGTLPYSGEFIPGDPLDNLAGCTANGVWSVEVIPNSGNFGAGQFTGWSISFDDPELSYTAELAWDPAAGLSDTNSLQPVVCPTQDITYTLTASDTAGCVTASDAINITVDTTDLVITATLTNPDCGATDGGISITVTGGSGSYTYQWSNGATSQNITNVGAGVYSVTVVDPAHCQEDTLFNLSTANGPTISSITPTAETCFGLNNGSAVISASGGTGTLSYEWSDGQTTATATGLAPGTYTITVSDALSCESVAITTVGAGINIIASFTATDESCTSACDGTITVNASGGSGTLSYQWSDGSVVSSSRTDLCPNLYSFTVSDANSCTESGSVRIYSIGALDVDLGEDLTFCSGLSGILDGGAASQHNWSTGETTQTIEVTQSGDYSVTVTSGACTASDTVTVSVTPGPAITALPEDTSIVIGNGVAITTNVGGATGNYFWTPPTFLSCDDCASPVATPTPEGDYVYIVTFFDQQECVGTDTVFITVLPVNLTPVVPSAFTPNGDGSNDFIKVLPTVLDVKEFRVYNRWGQEVHNAPTPWDGTFEGSAQPIGTFAYYAVVLMPDGTEKNLSGSFSLLR